MLDGDFDFFGTDLAELTLESLDGSEHITFDNDGKLGFLLFRQHIENVVERDFLAREVALAFSLATLFRGRFRLLEVFHAVEVVTRVRQLIDTADRDGITRSSLVHAFTTVVHDVPNAATGSTHHDEITLVDLTLLNNQTSHRSATFFNLSFKNRTLGEARVVSLQLKNLSLQINDFQKPIQVGAVDGRNSDHFNLPAPLHRIESIFGQLAKDPLNVAIGGFGLVNLVQSNHDGHTSRLGMVDGFHGLRHHTVIGGNHQNDHVGDFSPPSSHFGERFVTRSIDESDRSLFRPDLDSDTEGTGGLGDTTRFAVGNIRIADGIKQ